ncbi:GAF domain-containing sensor histidine kinase [Aneurinibacillus terranovensis]|uniref:GAF domain-containing sensor histidine kinase n=1 Tax=Aneurinibacillus terranovensis TaxID=278991 RepID=UPI000487FE25|nr:GAF domain-containing sensor histidine kinase [Aneurinibacillus terranovensis]
MLLFASLISPVVLSILFAISCNLLPISKLVETVMYPVQIVLLLFVIVVYGLFFIYRFEQFLYELDAQEEIDRGHYALRWLSRGFICWNAMFFVGIALSLSFQLFHAYNLEIYSFLTCIGVVMTTYSPFYFGILVQIHKYLYKQGSAVYIDLATWSRSAAISVVFALTGVFITTTLFVYIISKTFGNHITLYDVFHRAGIVSIIIGVPLIMLIVTIRRFYFGEIKRKQEQLRSLHTLSEKLYGNLEMDGSFLKDVVSTVKEVIGAKYAALALFDESHRIERFIPVGWEGEEGMSFPQGKGLLDHIYTQSVRTHSISHHPDSAGFPPGHPVMESFLGVPIVSNGQSIGSFYLTEKAGAVRFTPEDEEMVTIFSRSLAVAIENSRYVKELKKERKAAQEAAVLKSQILSTMSHELRTPLNAIIGYSDIIIENLQGNFPEKQRMNLQRIRESGKHLLTLINNILNLSKIESGHMRVNVQRVCLHSLLQFCLYNTSHLLQNKPVTLSVEGDDRLVILSDEQKLQQIIMNLISNAVKFTEEGFITIRVANDNDSLSLKIIDTGIGIPPEDLDTIFQPFKQLDGSLSRKYSGTGLGLSIVQSLVHILGGSLEVESEVGKGTCFTVKLPAEIEAATFPQAKQDMEEA